jgi:hypothetical protein
MTVEQRLDQLEKRNKRLTIALTMTVVAMCAVVTMAATGKVIGGFDKIGRFDVITANGIIVKNKANKPVVNLLADEDGNGTIVTMSAQAVPTFAVQNIGLIIPSIKAHDIEANNIKVKNDAGVPVVFLGATDVGNGLVMTLSAETKKPLVTLTGSDNGGAVVVYNKTGETSADMGTDDYGNGEVGAYNRKGEGRTLQPGP